VALSLLVVAHPTWAKSLNPGEVYTSLDGKRTIEVISKKELEITKRGDILLAQYNFRGDKLRVVYTALGTKMVEYYELTHDGLKDKDGNILYSKSGLVATGKELNSFFDIFKSAAMERDVEKIRSLTHPSCLSCVNEGFYQIMVTEYLDLFNNNMIIKEVRIENIRDKTGFLEGISPDLEFPVFPEKIIYEVGSNIIIPVASHEGKWKWVCPLPKNHETFLKILRRNCNKIAITAAKNAYTAAMAYFADFPKGKIDMTKLVQSGFQKSEKVEMSVVSGNQSDLKITASHVDGDKVYIINAQGTITAEAK